jgi:hypothetical protein
MRRIGKVEQRAIDIEQYRASPKIDRVDNHRQCPMSHPSVDNKRKPDLVP